MSAQSSLLNAISDNIANVSTTGYKQATTEFSSLVLDTGLTSDYDSGSVIVDPQVQIDGQGTLNATSSPTDLAVQGNGFFVVEGPNNQPVLTRVGSFTKNAAGNLVNAAGYTLLGYPYGSTGVANSFLGLVPINLNSIALQTTPTTTGKLYVNLPSNSTSVTPLEDPSAAWPSPAPSTTGTLAPSQNGNYANDTAASGSNTVDYTDKTSLVAYDDKGNQVTLDVYYTYVQPPAGSASTTPYWEVDVFNSADSTNGGFPYSVTSGSPSTTTYDTPLFSGQLQFNATGALTSITDNTSNTAGTDSNGNPVAAQTGTSATKSSITFGVPGGQPITLDLSQTTELATNYTVLAASTNGNAPSQVSGVNVATDGTVSVTYQDGSTIPTFTVPLANVQSPNKMAVITGNAYVPGLQSGAVQIGPATSGGLGSIESSTLEASTVDLATQLTEMIAAQNNYQADSKVFTTGSQLLQVLINLGH